MMMESCFSCLVCAHEIFKPVTKPSNRNHMIILSTVKRSLFVKLTKRIVLYLEVSKEVL